VAESTNALAAEARHFHVCLFHSPPDQTTVERYESAHRQLFPNEPSSPAIARIVERRLDAEAIEFALRRRGLARQLTHKLQVVSYLAEARARRLDQFVNLRASRARAWANLATATVGAAWKLCKGEYLIRRHGLL
jgi:hypothetical protein